MSRLDEIRERCEAATPGPWKLTKDGRYEDHDECRIDLPDDNIELCRYENGEFIAHARTDIPDLLGEVERLTAELVTATGWADELRARFPRYPITISGQDVMSRYDAWRDTCRKNGDGTNG